MLSAGPKPNDPPYTAGLHVQQLLYRARLINPMTPKSCRPTATYSVCGRYLSVYLCHIFPFKLARDLRICAKMLPAFDL